MLYSCDYPTLTNLHRLLREHIVGGPAVVSQAAAVVLTERPREHDGGDTGQHDGGGERGEHDGERGEHDGGGWGERDGSGRD